MAIRKKASVFLSQKVVSIVIAVFCLFLLFLVVSKLYNRYTTNQAAENARNTIDVIEAKLKALEKCQYSSTLVRTIKDDENYWFLMAWDKTNSERLDKCFFNNCICICPVETEITETCSGDSYEYGECSNEIKEGCQKKGFCRFLDYPFGILDKGEVIYSGIVSEKKKNVIKEYGFMLHYSDEIQSYYYSDMPSANAIYAKEICLKKAK